MTPTRRQFIHLVSGGSLSLSPLGRMPTLGTSSSSPSPADDPRSHLPTVNESIRASAAEPRLRMRFEGKTRADLLVWQQRFSEKMRELLGPIDPPTRWTVQSRERRTFDDFVREELLLQAVGVAPLPLYVLRPRSSSSSKLPIVLCLHGHGPEGHDPVAGRDDIPAVAQEIEKYNYDYARQLARQGYLTVAPCFTSFGRRLDSSLRTSQTGSCAPCAMTFARLLVLGRTLIGENLRDARWALSYAASRADALADRMGCVGLSYGGRMTMFTAAFDSRVRVAVASGCLNVYQERVARDSFCGAHTVPYMLDYGDTPEIGSLIAPRPVMWEVGSQDPLIVSGSMEIAKERLGRAYAASGRPEANIYRHFNGGHVWDGTMALPLLNRELKETL